MTARSRLLLSVPHLGAAELRYVQEAFATNWIAPLGPQVDRFEAALAAYVGAPDAAALCSGTAALHLALILAGVQRDDTVLASDLTFIGSVNPVAYVGARPVFVDADAASWNLDPNVLADALADLARKGVRPKALVVTHLYGLLADMDPILELCDRYGVLVIEDAAEALGATYKGRHAGTLGHFGAWSFNGNKIITTAGGGMLGARDASLLPRARFLATQARDPAPHYEHSINGFNYRLSNVLAGIGVGQMEVLEERVAARRANYARYCDTIGGLPGLTMMPSPVYGRSTHWLSACTIDAPAFGCGRDEVIRRLDKEFDIETRPVWKPMHLQPVFADARFYGSGVGARLFERGLCLPSSSSLTAEDQQRVIEAIRACSGQR